MESDDTDAKIQKINNSTNTKCTHCLFVRLIRCTQLGPNTIARITEDKKKIMYWNWQSFLGKNKSIVNRIFHLLEGILSFFFFIFFSTTSIPMRKTIVVFMLYVRVCYVYVVPNGREKKRMRQKVEFILVSK